jgi:hypothetical protein
MLIRRSKPEDAAGIRPSEITPESVFLNRRDLLKAAVAAGLVVRLGLPEGAHAASPGLNYTRKLISA